MIITKRAVDALNEELSDIRTPAELQKLIDSVPKNIDPMDEIRHWVGIKQVVVGGLANLATIEGSIDTELWRVSKGPKLRSPHELVLSLADNAIYLAQLAKEDELASRKEKVAEEGLAIAAENAASAEDSASAAKLGAIAAGVSAFVALVAILIQVFGPFRDREVAVELRSPVSIEGASIESLIAVMERIHDLPLGRTSENGPLVEKSSADKAPGTAPTKSSIEEPAELAEK